MRTRRYVVLAAAVLTILGGLFATTAVATAESTASPNASVPQCGEPAAGHVTISRGDSGPVVAHAQCLLRAHYVKVGIDGDFGPKTEAAVKKAQKVCKIDVDGIVGPDTWRCLHRAPR